MGAIGEGIKNHISILLHAVPVTGMCDVITVAENVVGIVFYA